MIATFPHEVLLNIFHYLPFKDRQLNVSLVCKVFHQIISDRVFDQEREEAKTRRLFPEKIISMIGGMEKLLKIPAFDGLDEAQKALYKINGSIRLKSEPVIGISLLKKSIFISMEFQVLVFAPEEGNMSNWTVSFLNEKNLISTFEIPEVEFEMFKKILCGKKELHIDEENLQLRMPNFYETTFFDFLNLKYRINFKEVATTPIAYGLKYKMSLTFIG